MITSTSNNISNLKNLWIELFMDKTNKVTNIADGSVLNATAYGTAKIAQKAIKDIAIVEAQIFPETATGEYLDKAAALFGVTPRKGALGSSTYVRVSASPGTVYGLTTYFIAKNGTRFLVDREITVDSSGYGYVSVRSTVTGSSTNVEANSITQVTPRPLTHIECLNEYQAVGGRDYEDDETFRVRIKNNDNKLSKGTVEYWTQIFQDLDSRVLRVMNVGLGEDAKTHIYLVTQNGSFFTTDELSILLTNASSYFGLSEIDLEGNSIGIVLENAEWMYVGGRNGVDFRVELTPGVDTTTVRKNIQVALTKYLDFRFWTPGKSVQWDDLLQVVKNSTGVKYIPDEYFNPFYDESVPLNQLPRIRGFIMRDLKGNVLFDADAVLSNIFYPAGEMDVYTGQQSQSLSQTQMVQIIVTNTRGAYVEGATISVGSKIVVTNSEGQATLLLENGEYEYVLSKPSWVQQTGIFVVLNASVSIIVNNFSAALQLITFNVLEATQPLSDVTILISNQTLSTNSEGVATVPLEPGTYSYSISLEGYTQIIGAVIVENTPLQITEYMSKEEKPVSFSVIDKGRNIFVPGASIWIQDLTKQTNLEGQTNMALVSGSYSMIVQKDGYLPYEKIVDVSNTENNCVLIELEATSYQEMFTVLDINTNLPISGATLSINGNAFKTNDQGIAIVSLIDGSHPYAIFKSGYAPYSGVIIMDGEPGGVVIKLNVAFWKTTFIVRDIDTGILLQGVAISIQEKSVFTNVNGEGFFLLSNNTYNYSISLITHKTVNGSMTVFDEEVSVNIFMQPKGRLITFIAKDSRTLEALPEAVITVTDKGTGSEIISITTDSSGNAIAELDRGSYNWVAKKTYYMDSLGSIEVNLKDFNVEFVMDLAPIEIGIKTETAADSLSQTFSPPELGPVTGITSVFTSLFTGKTITFPPTTLDFVRELITPGEYSCFLSGPGIVSETIPSVTISSTDSEKILRVAALTKKITNYFNTRVPETGTYFPFTQNVELLLQRQGSESQKASILTVSSTPGGPIKWPESYFVYGPLISYIFRTPPTDVPPTTGSDLLYKYYTGATASILRVDSETETEIYHTFAPMYQGVMRIILKGEKGDYLPVGEKFNVVVDRSVPFDYPYANSKDLTSINKDGVVMLEYINYPRGYYIVSITPPSNKYEAIDIFMMDITNQDPVFEKEIVVILKTVSIVTNVKLFSSPLPGAPTQIIDLSALLESFSRFSDIIVGPKDTDINGQVTLSTKYREKAANLNILPGLKWKEYTQQISLKENQIIDVEVASSAEERFKGTINTSLGTKILQISFSPTEDYVFYSGDVAPFPSSNNPIKYTYKTISSFNFSFFDFSPNKLTFLQCDNNSLTALDVSKCTGLTALECDHNALSSLDVTKNTSLTSLYCNNNSLTALDASNCSALTFLQCDNNSLTALNASNCTSLTSLNCNNNLLPSLDASNCTKLTLLQCSVNLISALDVTKCTKLTLLNVNNNLLTSLDVSTLTNLDYLDCSTNTLTALDVSKNTSLTSLNCSTNTISSLDLATLTKLTSLDCNFTSLTSLDCNNNNLTHLNASNCTSLTSLNCNHTPLTDLNVSNCTKLTSLYCNYTSISSLDVSTLTSLSSLNCLGSRLFSLDVTKNTSLTSLYCNNNTISSLDVTKNTSLTSLNCSTNTLSSLDVSKCTGLTALECNHNNLTSINVSNYSALTSLNCSNNLFSSLDVTNLTKLTSLDCSNNLFSSLDVTNLTKLTSLDCNNNLFSSLDVTNLTKLTALNVSHCTTLRALKCNKALLTLDTSNCTKLDSLNCPSLSLTSINVSNCTKLTSLGCGNNNLTAINVSNCTALNYIDVSNNTNLLSLQCPSLSIASLNVSYCTNLAEVNCSYNPIATNIPGLTTLVTYLPDRSSMGKGTLIISNSTSREQILHSCTLKNWEVL